jgi:hypothetical protein
MINGGETADRMVDYSLRFGETAVKLSGKATISLVNYLTALAKDNKKTKGKTRLVRMLKEGKELKVFQIDNRQIQDFARLAKTYGILFTALRDKQNPDQMVDLMVKLEDASKVSRVLERLKIASYDVGEIQSTLERDRKKANPTQGQTINSRSGTSSPTKGDTGGDSDRSSVREQIKQFKESAARKKVPDRKPVRKPRTVQKQNRGGK